MIVGAGLAGAKAAEGLRERGLRRPDRAARRGARAALRAPAAVEGLPARRERRARTRTSTRRASTPSTTSSCGPRARSTGIDTDARQVDLAGGERLGYDRLLLATGAEPRRLRPARRPTSTASTTCATSPTPTGWPPGWQRGGRLVVIGAGWIGAEVAASARQMGLEVDDRRARARCRSSTCSGPRLGEIYAEIHRDHGVDLHLEAGARGASRATVGSSGSASADGRDDRLRPGRGRGRRHAADRARRGGRASRSTTASLTDELLETSAPGVFAAGDVANALHPFYDRRLRVEHWANAPSQGEAAGRTMLGKPRRRRPAALLLLRPVRRRHGVLGARHRVGRGRLPRRPGRRASSSRSGSAADASSPA